MKKLLLIAIMFVGVSASSQVIYQPTFFGSGYVIDGYHVGQTQFKAKLLENPVAYNMWNQGTSNMTTGYILLYPSAAVLGWGIGTNLGNSIYDSGSSGTGYIVAGGAGLIGAYYLIAKGQGLREQALFHYNKSQNPVGWKPLINENGGGIAITF